jgi:molybdopterin converting factor small subunit
VSLSKNELQAVEASVQKELSEERVSHAKAQLKAKYKQLEAARVVVANIEREIEDFKRALSDGNG